jgi:DNA-binding beta-propeller fold protein YncE
MEPGCRTIVHPMRCVRWSHEYEEGIPAARGVSGPSRRPQVPHRLLLLFVVAALCFIATCSTNLSPAGAAKTIAKSHHDGPNTVVPTPKGLLSIAPPALGTIWVLSGTSKARELTEIKLATKTVLAQVGVSAATSNVATGLGGLLALGTSTPSTGSVQLFNTTNKAVVSTRPVAGPVLSLASSKSQIFALEGSATARAVVIIQNALALPVLQSIPVAKNAIAVLPPITGSGMLVLQSNGVVQEISTATSRVLSTFATGGPSRAMAVSPDGQTLYVLRYLKHINKVPGVGANVGVVDLVTEQVRRTLPAPAYSVAVLTAGPRLLYDGVGTSTYGNIQIYALAPEPTSTTSTTGATS